MKEETKVFRPSRSLWIVMTITAVFFLTLAVLSFEIELEWGYRAAFVALACLGPVGLVELAIQRVELRATELFWVSTFRPRSVPRDEVQGVTWGKGVGVSIQLLDGTWVPLPSVGRSYQGLTNTIRAWIKRTPRD